MTLNGEQSSALQALIDFLGSTTQIFILKGYAGTGKTTLMKSLLEHFKSSQEKRPIRVFAPTGRAAKILQEKTGIGSTIHKGIYAKASESVAYKNDEILDGENDKLIFKLKTELQHCRPIIIADEASMISAKTVPDDRLQFGTDNLLEDLLTYAGIDCGGQIIFEGDVRALHDSDTPTGRMMRADIRANLVSSGLKTQQKLRIENASIHNLKNKLVN